MPFTPRTRDAIRDDLLDDWAGRYPADRPLLTTEGSHAWRWASALALLLEAQEKQAFDVSKNILPDQADEASLLRHGEVEGLTREAATRAVLPVEISGTVAAVCTFGASVLTSAAGDLYTPSKNADGTGTAADPFNGSGKATIYATAQTAGADGTLAEGALLTWTVAPASTNPIATVVAGGTAGEDEEALDDYAGRILDRRRERPASGNRADWRQWGLDVRGVDFALVYALLHPTLGADTLGALTLLVLGPDQGDSVVNTRLVSADVLARVKGYIEGTNDADGVATPAGEQLRPVTMREGDYDVVTAAAVEQDVELEVVLADSVAPPWAYNPAYLVLAAPAPSNTTFSLVGNRESVLKPGGVIQPLLVKIKAGGAHVVRGDYYLVTPSALAYDGAANTNVTVAALPGSGVPVVGSVVLPPPGNWSDIRTQVFAYFDRLGPGDTEPASRWPGEETALRSVLYRGALEASVIQSIDGAGALLAGVQGVLNAEALAPGVDVDPAATEIATLGTLMVHPAP